MAEEDKKDEAEQGNEPAESEIYQGKTTAWLAYLGIFLIIPVLLYPENKFVRFHVRQGIVLLGSEILWVIVITILSFFPFLGFLFRRIIGPLGWLAFLGISIYGIINAVRGEFKKIPYVYDLADKFNIYS